MQIKIWQTVVFLLRTQDQSLEQSVQSLLTLRIFSIRENSIILPEMADVCLKPESK